MIKTNFWKIQTKPQLMQKLNLKVKLKNQKNKLKMQRRIKLISWHNKLKEQLKLKLRKLEMVCLVYVVLMEEVLIQILINLVHLVNLANLAANHQTPVPARRAQILKTQKVIKNLKRRVATKLPKLKKLSLTQTLYKSK